jgi:hypothetical protein
LSAPQLQSRTCAGTPSESQKSLADADGAVHITPAAKAAAAPPTVAVNILVFIFGIPFLSEDHGTPPPL